MLGKSQLVTCDWYPADAGQCADELVPNYRDTSVLVPTGLRDSLALVPRFPHFSLGAEVSQINTSFINSAVKIQNTVTSKTQMLGKSKEKHAVVGSNYPDHQAYVYDAETQLKQRNSVYITFLS